MYFLAQAYGYAHGREQEKKFSPEEAVLFGVQHLSHFFKVHSRMAWPLTPTVGLFLFIGSIYSPHFDSLVKSILYAGMIAMSILGVLAMNISGDSNSKPMALLKKIMKHPLLFKFSYLLVFVIVSCAAWIAVSNADPLFSALEDVWNSEILPYGLAGWTLMVVYAGSKFDGELDSKMNLDPTLK